MSDNRKPDATITLTISVGPNEMTVKEGDWVRFECFGQPHVEINFIGETPFVDDDGNDMSFIQIDPCGSATHQIRPESTGTTFFYVINLKWTDDEPLPTLIDPCIIVNGDPG